MSRLDDIRDALYRRKSDSPPPKRTDALPRPASDPGLVHAWSGGAGENALLRQARMQAYKRGQRVVTMILILAVLAVLAIVGFIGYTVFFLKNDLTIEITGPSQITAVEPTSFSVRIVNRNNVSALAGTLLIVFPEGAIALDSPTPSSGPYRERISVPDLPASGVFQKEIRVRLIGMAGEREAISATYEYRPENIEQKLTRRVEIRPEIVRVPLALGVDAPERVSSGQDVAIAINIDSQLQSAFSGLSLGVDFPSGFDLVSADPAPQDAKKHIWALGALDAGITQTITLKGKIRGDPEEVKAFHLRLGRWRESSDTWFLLLDDMRGPTIAAPFLFTQVSLDGRRSGSFAPGDRIDGIISFKNNLAHEAQNLTLVVQFPESLVELGTIQAEKGFYDVSKRALTWTPSSDDQLRELASGEEGRLAFSFLLKRSLPIRRFTDKNFSFPVSAIIDTASPPPEYRGVSLEYRDAVEFRIESPVNLAGRATYHNSSVVNSGPLPPKVRATTSYTIYLELSSGANDLADVQVKAELAPNIQWVKMISAGSGELTYNPANQEVTWRLATLGAATGILRAPLRSAFQISLTPAENQVGSSPALLRNIRVTARDTFTDTAQSDTIADLNTELHDDPQDGSDTWRVVP